MNLRTRHARPISPSVSQGALDGGSDDVLYVSWTDLAQQPACCCGAPARVMVVVPPSRERPRFTDLLLCGHHYRAARHSLQVQGLLAVDGKGRRPTAFPGR